MQLSNQYFLQEVTPLVERAEKGNGSQSVKSLKILQVRFSRELDHLKFCCIWTGCVQAYLVIISLVSLAYGAEVYSAKTLESFWVGAARPIQANSLFVGASCIVTVYIFANWSALSPYNWPMWSNLMEWGYQMFRHPSWIEEIHQNKYTCFCMPFCGRKNGSPMFRSSTTGRYLRFERFPTKMLNRIC